jgi:DNA-binding transcriptional LysR family regulator
VASIASFQPTPEGSLDANALAFFARVVEAGNFANAARELGLTRAAVSRRVAAIEQALQQTLFVRSTRSVSLTASGRSLFSHARLVSQAVDNARHSLQAQHGQLQGSLRITALPIFARSVLLPLLAQFRQHHPGLRLDLYFTNRRVDLASESIDVGFRATATPPEDYIATPVLSFELGAYAAPGTAPGLQHPQQLAEFDCLLFGHWGMAATLPWYRPADAANAAQRCLLEFSPAVQGDDLSCLIELAISGAGIVLAPDFAVRDAVHAGTLQRRLPQWQLQLPEGNTLYALTLPARLAGNAARELVRFVQTQLTPVPDED